MEPIYKPTYVAQEIHSQKEYREGMRTRRAVKRKNSFRVSKYFTDRTEAVAYAIELAKRNDANIDITL